MPHTLAAFRGGAITEWAATILARETACLDLSDRRAIDEILGGTDAERLSAMGPRRLEAEPRTLAYRLNPRAYVARRASAEAERRVTLRPAPDVMATCARSSPRRRAWRCTPL